MNRNKVLFLIMTLVLAIGLSACGQEKKKSSEQASGENSDKTVNVVINENGKPFGFVDDDGKFSGYDGELFTAIDEKLEGYTFKFNAVSRDALTVGLSTGKYDIAGNHFYITKERAEKYDYSQEPSGISDLRLIVREDEDGINSLNDLAAKGKKLVPIHTNDARYIVIEDYNKEHPDQQINLQGTGEQTAADMFKEVASGGYDAAIYPLPGYNAVTKDLDLKLKVSATVGLFPNVLLYHKSDENKELRDKIDKILIELKEDGTLAELSKKWFDEDVYALEGVDDIKVNTDWDN